MRTSFDRRGRTHARARLALLAVLVGAALAGCSPHGSGASDPTPGGSGATSLLAPGPWTSTFPPATWRGLGRSHMPLAVGNRWDYQVRHTTRIVSPGAPDGIGVADHPWVIEVVGPLTIGARDYFAVTEYDPRVVLVQLGVPMREDATGLYERDVITTNLRSGGSTPPDARVEAVARALGAARAGAPDDPAFAAAARRLEERVAILLDAARGRAATIAGPDADEITLLRYPLRFGARWEVRASPRFSRRVVGREVQRVPAGSFITWRIQGTGELLGPADRVRLWYAREGLVRLATHVETDMTDTGGNVIGRLIDDMDQVLTKVRAEPVHAF